MELIKPSEISGKIMSLIEEAEKFVFVVSPYYDISNWRKLLKKIEIAKMKGVEFTFCVRKPERESEYKNLNEIIKIGFNPIQIERLHAKLYFSEKEAIITSMNLTQISDETSLDIGLKTETKQEFEQIKRYYEQYISPKKETAKSFLSFYDFMMTLEIESSKIFKRQVDLEEYENTISIKGNNVYSISIEKEQSNYGLLKMNCILSEKEFEYLQRNFNNIKSKRCLIELEKGRSGYYSLIWATLTKIKSTNFYRIEENESQLITEVILDFIKSVETLKQQIRNL